MLSFIGIPTPSYPTISFRNLNKIIITSPLKNHLLIANQCSNHDHNKNIFNNEMEIMMKKLFAALLLTASLNAMAAPVILFPTCSFGPTSGQCTLINNSGKDINCNVQIMGNTRSGRMINGYEMRYLYNGMVAWFNVSNYNVQDPIVSLRANATCNTTN
jgi:hypothetical protein